MNKSLKIIFAIGCLALSWVNVASALSTKLSVAVWDFDNASFMDIAASDYLSKALPEMLMSQLAASPQIEVVERIQIREILEEQKLGSSDLADTDTKFKLGKIVGARYMIFGGFMVIGDDARVDVRLVDTETTEVLTAEKFEGKMSDLINDMRDITALVVSKLGGEAGKRGVGGGLDEWKKYEEGLVLIDAQKYEEALALFQVILEKNDKFSAAEKQIMLIIDLMARQ